ncbi:DUF962-domain-containing protein [Laetiporus sulphureus 93-53]|uniref:DUF962-domain-containing protein n=1 Tax=Laetiporus sulphureus 93-53 TaxID=1314785 RepID=A0A165ICS9_9APHY|nr:DUF962-domain-containing protein [Laetiporus sulphureus 93-53]KZT12904.1 DUF962-domain-containing protein [Laetiporus sulphureus 93-53]
MQFSDLLNVKKQLAFYGAYHNNPINIKIHQVCVPILIWTFQVMATAIPTPSFFPQIHYRLNDYLVFDFNWSFVQAAVYVLYYFLLEPTAAACYVPQMTLSVLMANAYSYTHNSFKHAAAIHIVCWIAQFAGHYGPEGRSPALLDNLIGAVVLAPFFVHLELLFDFGYKPELHHEIKNLIGTEILRVRRAEKEKARAAAAQEVGKKEE